MNWKGVFFLGWKYLIRNRVKTVLLVAAFSLVWLLPAAIAVVVNQVEAHLRERAETTPLLLGKTGSALELVFNGLYFTKPDIGTMPIKEVDKIAEDGLVTAIPIHAQYSSGKYRIVGTSLDYFSFRNLRFAEGRPLARLGECVVGSSVARETGVEVGDAIISSPAAMFDLAGVYPLKMHVAGVLEPTGSPDDEAIFVDVKTCWVIGGLGHGHQDAEKTGEKERLAVEKDDQVIRLNASIVEYNEITPENVGSFHFHGDVGDFPVTAAIVVPHDAKSQAIVKGRYVSSELLQLISPSDEMDELFETVFSVQKLVLWMLFAIGAATLAIGALVFLLSYRLRRQEFQHLSHLGADPSVLRALVGFESIFVIVSSLIVAGLLVIAIGSVAPVVIRMVMG